MSTLQQEQAFFQNVDGVVDDASAAEASRPIRSASRVKRHPLVSLALMVASGSLIYSMRTDLLFFLQPNRAVELGDVADALRMNKFKAHGFVSVDGLPDRKHSIRFQGRFDETPKRLYRLLETENRVFVEEPVKANSAEDRKMSGVHTGRVIPFAQLPYRAVLEKGMTQMLASGHEFSAESLQALLQSSGWKDGQRGTLVDGKGNKVAVTGASPFWFNVWQGEGEARKQVTHYVALKDVTVGADGKTYKIAGTTEFSADDIYAISLSTPFVMPKDAVVIREGEKPGDKWHYLLVHAILLGILGFNGWSLGNFLKKRRAS